MEFGIALIRNQAGEILGTAAILRDVTARYEREKELKKRLAALKEASGNSYPAMSLPGALENFHSV